MSERDNCYKVWNLAFVGDPKVRALKRLKGAGVKISLRDKVISATVERIQIDARNLRVILVLDAKCQDGEPLCLDMYPAGLPKFPGSAPFGSHVRVRPRFYPNMDEEKE